MKIARFVLKIVGASLTLAGGICLIIGFWDKLTAPFHCNEDYSRCQIAPQILICGAIF